MAACGENGSESQPEADMESESTGGAEMAEETAAGGECAPAGKLSFVCGPQNSEDLIQLGDTRWLLAGGLNQEESGGHIYLIDRRAKTYRLAFPGDDPAVNHDTDMFGACPGPVDTGNFSPHGVDVMDAGDGVYRAYFTSHGAREAIEVFDIDTSGAMPSVAWVGCVEIPAPSFTNAVAILPDGGFVATKMFDPTNPKGFAAVNAGEITGHVWEWHPGGEVTKMEGTDLSGPNGIAVSADGGRMFVAASGTREIVRYDLTAAPPMRQNAVTLGIQPDNLRWSPDGTLVAVGGNHVPPEECDSPPCMAGWSAVEIDPDTLSATRIDGVDETNPFQGASTALPVGDALWIGTYAGDRVAYMLLD